MIKTKYEIIEVNNIEITVDLSMLVQSDDMFFNATEIAKQFDKIPNDFLRLESTNKYIELILNDPDTISTRIALKDDLIRTRKGGKNQGTWLHQDLILQYARWLSIEFSFGLDKWIKRKLKEETERKKARLEAKTGYLELSEAIMNDHDPAKGYHFSNEANLINKIVLGMSAKKYKELHDIENIRDNLTVFEVKAIEKLQKMNTSMIDLDFNYEDRKEKLIQFYNEKMMLLE